MKKIFLALLFSSKIFCACQDTIANASVYPETCEGDWRFHMSGFYWNVHEDGLEFAVRNFVNVPIVNPTPQEIQEINHLIQDDLEQPNTKWEFGYRFGLSYTSSCDGWDVDLFWTHYSPSSFRKIEADLEDGYTLITLWSAFAPAQGEINYARRILATWKLNLDWIDLELGRSFWVSKYMSLRPFIGLRYAKIDQNYDLEHSGGSWSPRIDPPQDPLKGDVSLNNDYKGLGMLSGLESIWNFGCGWGFYDHVAISIIYGHFDIDHKEKIREALSPYTKTTILDSRSSFRASRAIFDLDLGIQWARSFCDCRYAFQARLSWEIHLFFHQNQLWRVVRFGDTAANNAGGENVFTQRRGTLDTQGWTLAVFFTF